MTLWELGAQSVKLQPCRVAQWLEHGVQALEVVCSTHIPAIKRFKIIAYIRTEKKTGKLIERMTAWKDKHCRISSTVRMGDFQSSYKGSIPLFGYLKSLV